MLQKNNVCFSPPNMPAVYPANGGTDFSHAVRVDCSPLSQFPSHATSQGTWETSQGKTQNFITRKRRIYKAHPNRGWRTSWSRARLSRLLGGARPGCTTPQIRWTCLHPATKRDTSPRAFGLSQIPVYRGASGSLSRFFLSGTRPHDNALVLLLTLGSANTWYGDFHPARLRAMPGTHDRIQRWL